MEKDEGVNVSEVRLSVRVSEEEKALVKGVADDYGLTMTDFIIRATRYIKSKKPKLEIVPKANSLASVN